MTRIATSADKELVVQVLSEAFQRNPGALILLKKEGDKRRQMRILITYIFYQCVHINGVYISDNEKAVACCYQFNKTGFSIRALFWKYYFAFTCIGIKNMAAVLKRENFKKSQRPVDGNYLYFWFFGALKDGDRAAWELKNTMFEMARKLGLDIYAETTIERNREIYTRFGFETFYALDDKAENLTFWFMRWSPLT